MTTPASPDTSMTPSTTAPAFPASLPGNFAELYERVLVAALFKPWAEQLLNHVPLGRGGRVLDVACGTGIVARLALARLNGQGRVVGVDRNPGMLAVARTLAPAIEWREGDAAELPVAADEHFDAVFCHEGLQFFPDRAAAVRGMHAALAPEGRVGIAVWRSLEENSLFHDLGRVAERVIGPIDDHRHGFADADALERLLLDAGFTDVKVEPVSLEVRFEIDPAVLVRMNAMAVIGMSARGKTLSEADRASLAQAVVEASMGEVARYTSAGVLAFETSANLATGRR